MLSQVSLGPFIQWNMYDLRIKPKAQCLKSFKMTMYIWFLLSLPVHFPHILLFPGCCSDNRNDSKLCVSSALRILRSLTIPLFTGLPRKGPQMPLCMCVVEFPETVKEQDWGIQDDHILRYPQTDAQSQIRQRWHDTFDIVVWQSHWHSGTSAKISLYSHHQWMSPIFTTSICNRFSNDQGREIYRKFKWYRNNL